jgi:hypothetical protein
MDSTSAAEPISCTLLAGPASGQPAGPVLSFQALPRGARPEDSTSATRLGLGLHALAYVPRAATCGQAAAALLAALARQVRAASRALTSQPQAVPVRDCAAEAPRSSATPPPHVCAALRAYAMGSPQ